MIRIKIEISSGPEPDLLTEIRKELKKMTAALQAKLEDLKTAQTDSAAAIANEIAQFAASIPVGTIVTQAHLDQVQAVIDGIVAGTASLKADDPAPAV